MMQFRRIFHVGRLIFLLNLLCFPLFSRVYCAKDARVMLAEHLSLIEVLRHVTNRDELLKHVARTNQNDLLDYRPIESREQIIGKNYILLERYFCSSNIGFKCYVNLESMTSRVLCYGRNCKEVIWKNVDEMMREKKSWDALKGDDEVAFSLLDFILSSHAQIYVCENGRLAIRPRNFAATDLMDSIVGDTLPCSSSNVVFINEPYANDGTRPPILRELTYHYSGSHKLRFYALGSRGPFLPLAHDGGGSYLGPMLNFDW